MNLLIIRKGCVEILHSKLVMNEIISVRNVKKEYRIHEKAEGIKNGIANFFHRKYIYKAAVKNVNFSIEEGQIVGLLGENGAGKTTMLKMLTGILFPTEGEINVSGFTPTDRKKEFLKSISFVMGNKAEVNWDLPAVDTFRYQQLVYEVPENEFQLNLKMMSELLDVQNLLKVPIRHLSLGERMKMELINNFIYSPRIVFLDEPTLGLDIKSQMAIREFIKAYRKEKNTTIIITSHYMDDIEETCDRVILLNKGEKIYDGNIGELKKPDLPFKNIILNLIKDEEKK